MGKTTQKTHGMTDVTIQMGEGCADFLRHRYPRHTAKRVAYDLSRVAPDPDEAPQPRTVERWLTGAPPSNKHFALLVMRWGMEFVTAYLGPLLDQPDMDDIDRRFEAVTAQLDALRARAVLGLDTIDREGGAK